MVPPLPSEIWRVSVKIGGASNTENVFQMLFIDQPVNFDDFHCIFRVLIGVDAIFFKIYGVKYGFGKNYHANPWFTRDIPVIYPWYTVIYPGKTCVYVKTSVLGEPVIYPWPTHDLPVINHDLKHGFRVDFYFFFE